MKVVFISNYYTHHQAPFCQEMYKLTKGDFWFIETSIMTDERKKMGWAIEPEPFVVQSYVGESDYSKCIALINSADVVIKGDGEYRLIKERLKIGKLTFLYSERIYRNWKQLLKLPFHYIKFGFQYRKYPNLKLLCASAFTYSDFLKIGCFKNNAYKWGYFPAVKRYESVNLLLAKKTEKRHLGVSILWVARLIKLKHPEYAIEVARRLKEEGIPFHLNIIGDGPQKGFCLDLINNSNLNDCVSLLGSMPPDDVREYMEASDIFLFTSDKNEGWGAVLNESMNSGCAVIASSAIGSVPFMVDNKKNGLIYRDGDVDDLFNCVKFINSKHSIAS